MHGLHNPPSRHQHLCRHSVIGMNWFRKRHEDFLIYNLSMDLHSQNMGKWPYPRTIDEPSTITVSFRRTPHYRRRYLGFMTRQPKMLDTIAIGHLVL